MTLDDIRKDIDKIDFKLRDLLMQRFDCSAKVARTKIEDGNYTIYRADREEAILDKLGKGVPEDKKPEYLALVRKITEMSRMYQYGILYEEVSGLFDELIRDVNVPDRASSVKIILTRPNIPNAMSSILSMVGDYGFNMEKMELLSYADDISSVNFELTILGDIHEERMKKLMLQLSKESTGFKIIEVLK